MKCKNKLACFIGFTILFITYLNNAMALRLPLPPPGVDLTGHLTFAMVQSGDDFAKIARRYDIGYFELEETNPQVDSLHPRPGTEVIIPTQYLLPKVPRQGLVINLASMRLFYFPQGASYFYTYPVGIGKYNWSTPLGQMSIIQKIKNPIWTVPESIMKYREENGDPVPKQVPAGPDNPLGKFAMRLSSPTYMIHGTNDPASVGRRSSAGCIHLYPEDIKALFSMLPLKTPVLIINQPYKAGWADGRLYMEAHLPLKELRDQFTSASAVVISLIDSLSDENSEYVNWLQADNIIRDHTGIPTVVGHLET